MARLLFSNIQEMILCEFYVRAIRESESDFINNDGLSEVCPKELGLPIFLKAVESLTERELIEKSYDSESAETRLEITYRGLNFVDNHIEENKFDDNVYLYMTDRGAWVDKFNDDLFGPSPFENTNIPASDRTVSIDHNSSSYEDTIEALDSAINAVRGDNEYGSRDPQDKEQRISELAAGRQLFDSVRVSIQMVDYVLMKTLLYLAGIGVAVTQVTDAIEKIKILFGF